MSRMAGLYLIAQAGLTLGWWLLLVSVPESRALFKAADHPDGALLAFWLADLVAVAGGSALAGVLLLKGDRRATGALWFTCGALVYAALYCIAVTSMTGDAGLATGLMVPAATVTVLIACRRPG